MTRYLSAGLFVGLAACAAADPVPVEIGGVKLTVSAGPEAKEFMLGEPGFVAFRVYNPTDRPLAIAVGGDYRNRLGRPDSFRIDVVGPDGKKVLQPDAGFDMGGICYSAKLPARGEYAFRLFLPHWATFEKPGTYTMTIRRKLTIEAEGVGKVGEAEAVATTTVTIAPADAAKFGKLIDQLGKVMLDRTIDRAEEAQKVLTAIHDDRVVPYFVALAKKPHSSPRYAACGPLGRYKNDQALEALKRLATTTGTDVRESATTLKLAESSADGIRHAAVHALGDSPHPKALAHFWTYADDPYVGVRLTVLHKAAEMKTPEARALVMRMTADPSEMVRNEAKLYQTKLDAEK